MAVESAVFLRRVARIVTLVLTVALLGCASAWAQASLAVAGAVLSSPQINLGSSAQIYKILVAKNGNVLFLDSAGGALYQLAPGATSVTTISGPGAVLKGGNNFWNAGMALDANDTLYIGNEWNTPYFLRVPYDAATGTWPLNGGDDWPAGDAVTYALSTGGPREMAFDDAGNMFFSTQSGGYIAEMSISADGSTIGAPGTKGASGTYLLLAKGLMSDVAKLAVDHADNLYFIEDPWASRSNVAEGVWKVPAGQSGFVGESNLTRIDPPAAGYNFKGITVDSAGNLYFSSVNDGYGGNETGILMVPNESGNPKSPSFSSTWADAMVVSPLGSSAAVAIDPRGFLWISTFTGTGVNSIGSSAPTPPVIPYTSNWAAYSLGNIQLSSTPVGTPGSVAALFYAFSGSVTPGSIKISQPGSGSDFSASTVNPLMIPATKTTPATVDTSVVPCTAGTTYLMWNACPYWIAENPRVAGAVSGQLQMFDATNKLISGSTTYLYGAGQGPAISFIGANATSAIGAGFTTPLQVAEDSLGNTYVADSGLKKVLQYPAGSTASTTPVSILSGLTAPTGVAVDGIGNVFIGDSGQIIEVPYQSGALNASAKTVIQTGLGNHLNLAIDGAGNLYIADQDKAQVIKITNPALRSTIFSGATLVLDSGLTSGGFTAPSAVAVDAAGDLFVADGNNLDEVIPTDWQVQTTITNTLSAPVTALAVDASGSVYVAQKGGLTWIPAVATSANPVGLLTVNDAIPVPVPTGVTPVGLALDRTGNLYVSGSGTTPSVTQLSIAGSYSFGQVIPNVETDQEVQVYNTGNLPLTLSALASDPTTLTDFYAEAAGDAPTCGPSLPLPGGTPCFLGVGVTPSAAGLESATLTIKSNATNAPSATLTVAANAQNDTRNKTTTVITGAVNVTYPGSETITVTVTSAGGTPQGVVKLSFTGHGTTSATLNSSGVATFSFTKLGGGTYDVSAVYQGFGVAGTAPNYAVSSTGLNPKIPITVALATPTITVSTPSQYVPLGGTYQLTMGVSSAVGTPTGTLRVMNGSSPADPTQDPIPLNNAVFSTSNLTTAAYSLKVVYGGDANYSAATITVPTFSVVPPSVQITSSPATLTLTKGTPGTVTLTLQSIVSYGSTYVSLVPQCVSGVPQYAECTFDNNAIPMLPGQAVTIHMSISTNAPVNETASLRSGPANWTLAGIFGIGLFGLAFGRKTRFNGRALTIVCLMLILAGTVFGVTACTNSGYTHTPPAPVVVTPSGTYSVGITVNQYNTNVTLPLPSPVFYLPVTVQ